MRIVVLDGYVLNPGDLSWQALEALGSCTVYDRTAPGEVVARSQDAEVLLTNKTVLSREHLEQLPALRLIGVLATGYDVVDAAAARQCNVPVVNVPAYSTPSVAQLTFAHILNLTLRVADHAQAVRQGKWSRSPDYCFWDYPLVELAGRTLGVVGLGDIGSQVAAIARAFGMHVLATVRTSRPEPEGVRLVDLETLFRTSDVVSLHCPLTDETRQLVNAQRLGWMKPSAFLINTSRGGLVDEQALAGALERKQIAGAGLDVLTEEPPRSGSPLFAAPNVFITPHIAWATRASRARLMRAMADNIAAFASGHPANVVN